MINMPIHIGHQHHNCFQRVGRAKNIGHVSIFCLPSRFPTPLLASPSVQMMTFTDIHTQAEIIYNILGSF